MISFLRNSLFSSTIISFGKIFTIVLLICLLINPSIVNTMPPAWRTTVGMLSLTFAALGLFACFWRFSHVMVVAGFWVIAIYFLSSTFLQGGINMPGFFTATKSFPKIIPGGLIYDDIPDSGGDILNANYSLPSSKGLMDTIYSYVSAPLEQVGSSFDIASLGLKSANFNDMTFNSGVLPDSAYFAASSGKHNYYPIKSHSRSSGLSMGSLLSMIPSSR